MSRNIWPILRTEEIDMTDRTNKVRITRPGEGRTYDVLGASITVLSSGRPGDLLFADHPVPVGYGVPLHVHEDEDEALFVLDGAITFVTPEGETIAGPGSFVHLPRGAAHGFRNDGRVEA